MAVIKHISIKNSNYDAAYDYLTTKHDEFTSKPILDENGKKIPRESFIIEGINCDPTSFGRECEDLNEAARRELQELTGQKKFPSLKDIKSERTALYQQKHAQYEAYSEARAHDKELANIEANMNVILDRDKPEITKDKSSL